MKLFDFGTGIVVVTVAAIAIVSIATISSNSQRLCDALGGVYTPENNSLGKDVCPGGKWLNLFRAQPK